MKKYKIINSTNQTYLNIEMPFDFEGKEIQDDVNVFGVDFKITQIGTVVQCISKEAVMTFQEIPEEVKETETEETI